MSRFDRVLESKLLRFGLPLIAGGLVLSEGYLWWRQLGQRSPLSAETTFPAQVTAGSEAETAPEVTLPELENLTKVATFGDVINVPDGVFKYGGSTTWAPVRKGVDAKIGEKFPSFKLQYTDPAPDSGRTPGSGTGIRMLLDGELLFSQSSRVPKDEEKAEAERSGYSLEQVPVAIDGIAVAVNPELNLSGLTLEQLKKIYTGEITNWREVGGPDLKIAAYSRSLEDAGTVEFFAEEVLGEAQFAPTVRFVANTTIGIRQTANTEGAIYYASAPEIVGQCLTKPLPLGETVDQLVSPYQSPYVEPINCPTFRNQLNAEQFQNGEYPITRVLYVIVKRNGDTEEAVGTAYANLLLSDEGQALIEASGFVGVQD